MPPTTSRQPAPAPSSPGGPASAHRGPRRPPLLPPARWRRRLAVLAALLAVSAPPAAATEDPRVELVELQRQGRDAEALAHARRLLADDPDAATLGLHYLAGRLAHRLGRPKDAAEAFVQAIGRTPELAGYSRYRAAVVHDELGHPEMAAGLVAGVVAARSPEALVPEAARLLRRTLARGGDCRLLGGVDPSVHASAARRQLELAAADCALRGGESARARDLYLALLDESVEDEPAREAADRLAAIAGRSTDARTARLLGRTFHQHRDYGRAIAYLGPLVAGFTGALSGERYELAYTLVRSRFWQEEYAQAAAGFSRLAARARDPRLVARALYQQARSHELLGEGVEAARTYRLAYRTDPEGRFADAALIGALRIEHRAGQEAAAAELFELLTSRREWIEVAARAALFLAASDLVQGRADRAGGWLAVAERAGADTELEVAYWRGRLAELGGDADAAVRRYLVVLRRGGYHPLALDAAGRLASPALEPAARALARRLAGGGLDDRYGSWLLLAGDPEARASAAHDLARRLAGGTSTGPWLTLSRVPAEAWPLWGRTPERPEELLLALGLFDDGAPALDRHFPYSREDLGFTAAWMLAGQGAVHASLRRAETLARRAPDAVPEPFLAYDLRRLLYPFGWSARVSEQAMARGVDPYLLAAIIREESRYDPRALSAASARGLTQFVMPTALETAPAIGLDELAPEDLYRPEIAIALGAAYLGKLLAAFDGTDHAAVAAYNAGPPAARMWQRLSYTDELAEYYTKVSFGETRNYLRKVLSSRAHYHDVYGSPLPDPGGRP